MIVPYTFRKLLAPLEGTREGAKLAVVSGQVKIEHDLLAEIMFNGKRQFPNLDFYLEEERRDLTVRTRQSDSSIGLLIDWVEAKMCYTDDLARSLTGYARPLEYRDLLRADAEKQERGITAIPQDRGAQLTSLLFAIQHDKPVWRHKYYPGFRNRGEHAASAIEQAAREHVHKVIAPFIRRDVVEEVMIRLDEGCRLHVFALRAGGGVPPIRQETRA